MKGSRKRIMKWVAISVVLYGLVFIPLWLGGGYILTESGKVRQMFGIPTGIAAPDVAEWQPLVGHFQPEYHWPKGSVAPRCDFIGWAYYPLLALVCPSHPSVRLLTTSGEIVGVPAFPLSFRLHPLRGTELNGILRSTH